MRCRQLIAPLFSRAGTACLRLLPLALSLCLLAACADEPPPQPPLMQFDVDPARLGEPVEDAGLGIRFQPPAGWTPLSASAVDSVRRAAAFTGAALDLQPRHLFLHAKTKSLLSVALLPRQDSVTFEAQMATYGQALARQFSGDSLRQAAFLKDGIHVVQFLAQLRGLVNFKLVFAAGGDDLLQFDYVVPQEHYPGAVKALESSIGSIQRLE